MSDDVAFYMIVGVLAAQMVVTVIVGFFLIRDSLRRLRVAEEKAERTVQRANLRN